MSNFAMLRDELLAEIETIAPVVREYASQSEQLGRLAEPIIKAVRQTSLLRFICAHELGGCEADPLTVMEVTEALSRIDGSVGWTLGIIANATALAGAFLPAESARRVFGSGVPIIVGALQPRNSTAEPVVGGYLVNGRWSFGSGIHFADWVVVGALVPGQSPPDGLRVAVLPREQVTVHDNWQVAGLRGTGSCDFSIDNEFVPDNMTFSIMDAIHGDVVTGEKVMFRLGFPAFFTAFHVGVPLGIARRALDEIATQAISKSRGITATTPLAAQPQFQATLGKIEVQFKAARALAIQALSRGWAEVCTGRTPPAILQAEIRSSGTYIDELGQQITTEAFQAAGGSALFDSNPLQRCLRDAQAAGQHFAVSRSAYRNFGMFKLGQPDAQPYG